VSMWTVQPKEVQAAHERFLKFKEDLEARLQQWLVDHPVPLEPTKHAPVRRLLAAGLPALTGKNKKIEVLPSTYLDGGWVVKLDDFIVQSYYGSDAHARASKLAVRLANDEVSPDDPELQF
jgi:hypothetical protein